jgi:hypothetical protein
MTQKIERQIARPMDSGAKDRVDWFLRTQEEPFEGLPRYKRIDTTDKKQLQELAERKLFSHFKEKQIHSLKTFVDYEIRMGRQYQNWFNKKTERRNIMPLNITLTF